MPVNREIHYMRNYWKTLFSAILAIGFSGIGNAMESGATNPFSSTGSDWKYRITPYLWAAGLDGKVSFAGRPPAPPVEVNPSASFSDTLSRLDIGGMAFFEGRRDRFGFFGDLFYIRISDSASGSVSLPSLPTATVGANLSSTTMTAMLAGQYRAVQSEAGSLDLMLGARFWSLNNRVHVSGEIGSLDGGIARKLSGSWAAPVLGAKGLYRLTPNTYVTGWAMTGGPGISDYSSWDLMAAFGYSFSDHIALLAGYRYLSLDYKRASFTFDAALHGPGIGLDFRF